MNSFDKRCLSICDCLIMCKNKSIWTETWHVYVIATGNGANREQNTLQLPF